MDSITKNVVALAGGVGGAKLAYGLAQIVPPEKLTIVVNTADDFEHLGLHIAPDLDTVMYTLAGLANPVTGWGVRNDSFNMLTAMAIYAGPTWFRLGDRDLATHLLRTRWLREGFPYNWVTNELSRRLGVRCSLLPMTESPVRTMVETEEGTLPFQEYFVRRECRPVVTGIRFDGAEEAQPSREVAAAIRSADVIILCPSNPLVSLDPILSIATMRRLISASQAYRVAVSPIVGGQALKGPAAKMMAELKMEVTPVGVASHFQDILTGFVLDHADAAHQDAVTDLGLRTLVTNTVMKNDEDKVRLAGEVLVFAQAAPEN